MEKQIILNGVKTDYSATTDGIIYSNKNNRKIQISYSTVRGGYKMCYLYVSGKRFDLLVHRVIALTFIELICGKNQINHIDGNKENNKTSNLEWCNQSENITHAYKTKLMTKSYKDCWNASLTEEQVKSIRADLLKKIKQRDVAKKHGISEQIVSNIKNNRSYVGIGIITTTLTENPYK